MVGEDLLLTSNLFLYVRWDFYSYEDSYYGLLGYDSNTAYCQYIIPLYSYYRIFR